MRECVEECSTASYREVAREASQPQTKINDAALQKSKNVAACQRSKRNSHQRPVKFSMACLLSTVRRQMAPTAG
jgi:hypothetical protein